MSEVTRATAKAAAIVVRDEVAVGANTATRVGGLLEDIVDSAQWKSETTTLIKARALADSNIASLSGLATSADGVTLSSDGDTVVLTAQSTASENGPWDVHSGAWTRPASFPAGGSAAGAVFQITEGTNYGDTTWTVTTDAPNDIIDTDALTIAQIAGQDWAATLALGASTDGTGLNNPRISAGDSLEFIDATRSLTATAATGIIADIPTGETYDFQVNAASKLTVGAAVTVASGVQLQIGDNQRYITTGAVNGIAYHSGITGSQVHEFFTGNVARLELASLNATFKVNGYILRWYNSSSSPYDVLKGLNGDVTLSAESGRSLTLSGTTISLTGLSHLAIGTDPADTGTVRLPALGSIYGEASPTGADVPMIAVDAAEAVIVGGDAGATGVQLRATTSLGGYVGGGQIFAATASAFTYHQPLTSSGTTATLATSAGTWMTGTTALTTVIGSLNIGSTATTSGAIRTGNGTTGGWYSRNAAGTQAVAVTFVGSDDRVYIGDTTNSPGASFIGSTSHLFGIGGTNRATITSTAIQAAAGIKFDTASGTGELSIGGSSAIRYTTTTFGVRGSSPVAAQTYTITNDTTQRTIDADTISLTDLADVVATMLRDDAAMGIRATA